MSTVEIESILGAEELVALLDAGEASGQIRQTELQELLEPLELDALELEAVNVELDRRGIELIAEEPEKEREKEKARLPRRRPRLRRRRRRPTRSSSSCARPGAISC